MLAILALLFPLLAIHAYCLRRARRTLNRMMRPAEHWEANDLDHWLSLIEPFPLGGDRHPNPRP